MAEKVPQQAQPPSPPQRPTSSGLSPAPRPSPSPSPRHRPSDGPSTPHSRLTRTQSKQDRISEILETARMRASNRSASQSQSPSPLGTSPRMEPLLRNQPGPSGAPIAEQESSADEATGIFVRGSNGARLNYQSTAQDSGTGPRARKTRPSGSGDGSGGGAGKQAMGAQPAGQSVERRADEKEGTWWKRLLASVQSIELENKGSVARDHLALERTFLAWLRTSLAFASIGIAITQLFRLNTTLSNGPNSPGSDADGHIQVLRRVGVPLGATFLGISILILFLGYNRYRMSQQWIMRGKFPASRGTIIIVSLVAFGLMIASLVVVVVVQPAPRET